jgi:hypothetical protein
MNRHSAAIRNVGAAVTLALDDDFAVQRAQFDLANVPARAVNLLGDQGRALRAAASFASRHVPASVDANGRWRGVEIGLEHERMMCLDAARIKARAL